PNVGGPRTRECAGCACVGDDRARDPRYRSDPHRIATHPKEAGYIHFLPRLRRTHQRRRRRRGTQSAPPTLCRCAISGLMADGVGRRSGAAATRRRVALVEATAGGPDMSGRLVLVRHGQSHSNVERRLDTRPPGRELTDLGREQARIFGRGWPNEIEMVAHSIAVRATQTAAEIAAQRGIEPLELDGIYEAQVGDLEDRNDDAAIEEFRA